MRAHWCFSTVFLISSFDSFDNIVQFIWCFFGGQYFRRLFDCLHNLFVRLSVAPWIDKNYVQLFFDDVDFFGWSKLYNFPLFFFCTRQTDEQNITCHWILSSRTKKLLRFVSMTIFNILFLLTLLFCFASDYCLRLRSFVFHLFVPIYIKTFLYSNGVLPYSIKSHWFIYEIFANLQLVMRNEQVRCYEKNKRPALAATVAAIRASFV